MPTIWRASCSKARKLGLLPVTVCHDDIWAWTDRNIFSARTRPIGGRLTILPGLPMLWLCVAREPSSIRQRSPSCVTSLHGHGSCSDIISHDRRASIIFSVYYMLKMNCTSSRHRKAHYCVCVSVCKKSKHDVKTKSFYNIIVSIRWSFISFMFIADLDARGIYK